jgi:hypothetical protein
MLLHAVSSSAAETLSPTEAEPSCGDGRLTSMHNPALVRQSNRQRRHLQRRTPAVATPKYKLTSKQADTRQLQPPRRSAFCPSSLRCLLAVPVPNRVGDRKRRVRALRRGDDGDLLAAAATSRCWSLLLACIPSAAAAAGTSSHPVIRCRGHRLTQPALLLLPTPLLLLLPILRVRPIDRFPLSRLRFVSSPDRAHVRSRF